MIAVDTSALMAVVLGSSRPTPASGSSRPKPKHCCLAGTLAEALIVAARRNVGDEMARLIEGLGFEIVTRSRRHQRGVLRRLTSVGAKG